MKTLHIVNKSPEQARFGRCLAAFDRDDQLLLTENAVIAAGAASLKLPTHCFALEADLKARGLTSGTSVVAIDYQEMVKLTVEADRVICW